MANGHGKGEDVTIDRLTRRQFLLAGAAVGAGMAASACGGSSKSSTSSHLTGSSGTLNVLTYPTDVTPHSSVQAVFDGFSKATGVKVKQIAEPSDYATFVQKITTALSSGYTGYDVIYLDDFTTQTFAAANWIIPLPDSAARPARASLSKTHANLSSYKGNLYRIPVNQSFYVQFYRKDLLAKANLNVPTTWAELLSTARALTKNGHYGLSLAGVPSDAFDDFLYFMPQAGGNFLNLELPGSQKALEFLHDLVSVYKVVPPSYVTDSYTNIPTYVENGNVSLWASWNGFMDQFVSDASFFKGGKTLGVVAPAKGPKSNVTDVGDWGWGVSKYSPRQAAGVKFVQYATSKASEVQLAHTQSVPARLDAVRGSESILIGGSDFARILSQVQQVPRPITPKTTLIQNSVTPILVDYVAGKTSLKSATKSGQALIKKYSS